MIDIEYNDARIDNFIDASVRRGSMSAKYENMCNLLGKFDKAWADKFKTTVAANSDGKKMIDASNSLVENRHGFAHGRNPTATFIEIKQYYLDVLQLITIFDSIVT